MTDNNPESTHIAYFFIRLGMRKGKVFGYWKDGGWFKPEGDGNYFLYSDMLPRPGWDGRIRIVKIGDPVPGTEAPQRPADVAEGDDSEEAEE